LVKNKKSNFNIDDEVKKKIAEQLLQNLSNYRKSLRYLSCDAPIQVLCLVPIVERILLKHGFNRIYDIIDADLVKIKGLSDSRIRYLTARLNEFISVC